MALPVKRKLADPLNLRIPGDFRYSVPDSLRFPMRLTKLILEQFRNYKSLELDFNSAEPITYIVGPNAQGKTNILESIYLLALTKSFRTTKQQDMIGWESEYARVKGFFEIEGEQTLELEAFFGKPPQPQKSLKKNGVKTGAANFIGNCQVVFFHPEDLNMLYLGPDLRRAYLNVMNVQVNRKYFNALRSYQKVLKQRNALLHAIRENRATPSELDVWDDQLIEHGSCLMQERAKTVNYFQKQLTETYRKISEGSENVKIGYHHTLDFYNRPLEDQAAESQARNTSSPVSSGASGLPASAELHPDLWRSGYAKNLASARARDLQALVTTVGPHRDDLEFSFNGLRLASHASRGEYRSLLLTLKFIELKFFRERTGKAPLLLLDDVFSELDPQRQKMLLQAIEGHQTIITATHLDDTGAQPREHRSLKNQSSSFLPGNHFEVRHGKIIENML